MNDWGLSVLDQYEVTASATRKVRGALLCETSEGSFLLQSYHGSEKRLLAEFELLQFLGRQGDCLVDEIQTNRQGGLSTENEEKTSYLLKAWFPWAECSVASRQELLLAVRLLGKLHLLQRRVPFSAEAQEAIHPQESHVKQMERHIREMRRVQSYLHRKKTKNEFEKLMAGSLRGMLEEAAAAMEGLVHSRYEERYRQAVLEGHLCHGAYHQHNVLIGSSAVRSPAALWGSQEKTGGRQAAAVNFENFSCGVQLGELAFFLRKVLEKHSWNAELGMLLVEEYGKLLPLDADEREILMCLLLFPEKYWKQVNFYINGKKAWIPEKNLEKLKNAVVQTSLREAFISRQRNGRGERAPEFH